MIQQCPHCQGSLRFSPEQQNKLEQAFSALEQGKYLSLKCPHCQQPIKLDNNGMPENAGPTVPPPGPPNLDWLESGTFQGEDKVEDVPMALFLFDASEELTILSDAMKSVGYQVVIAKSAADAMERMRFTNFACVVYQAGSIDELKSSDFHEFMEKMPMDRRRYIFYVLIGPAFQTLYNLQALAYSANLVLNSRDIRHFELILRKAIPDYEEMFGPFIEEISAYGIQ